jgi:hypothetical protein
MGLETVEAIGPFEVREAEPVIHGTQAFELKSRRAALAVASAVDETGPLQHLEVFGDGRLCQRGGFREFDDPSVTGPKAPEDRTASWVSKGGEGAAQRIMSSHYR